MAGFRVEADQRLAICRFCIHMKTRTEKQIQVNLGGVAERVGGLDASGAHVSLASFPARVSQASFPPLRLF